jgi:C-terminal processing protease CtpA/Prc
LAEGDFNEASTVTIEHKGKTIEIEVLRDERVRDMQLRRPGTLEWIDDEIMYIDGTRLNDFEMMELMPQFESAKGLIIDLRGDALLSEHVLGFFVSKDFPSYKWTLKTYTNPCESPIENTLDGYVIAKQSGLPNNVAFISGETTVGKAETILRLVKSNNIGKIIGEETVGSYDVVNSIKLPEFYNFSMGIYPISYNGDNEIKFKPIIPDVKITAKGDFPNDPKINKAVEVLKGN